MERSVGGEAMSQGGILGFEGVREVKQGAVREQVQTGVERVENREMLPTTAAPLTKS